MSRLPARLRHPDDHGRSLLRFALDRADARVGGVAVEAGAVDQPAGISTARSIKSTRSILERSPGPAADATPVSPPECTTTRESVPTTSVIGTSMGADSSPRIATSNAPIGFAAVPTCTMKPLALSTRPIASANTAGATSTNTRGVRALTKPVNQAVAPPSSSIGGKSLRAGRSSAQPTPGGRNWSLEPVPMTNMGKNTWR